ncbi:SDR family oxidoreductase [Bacillus sp. DNRA2]|uniref:elongation factor P 5-aminopentanone reductase n=1 Tax=Bacillus sp. DNRA2 TaxID=2723053 RepID=UPI00145F61DE|nr:SDR family NAD(P)-dependent oxidoreductase [Bacillus sp. DNRA2]NMD69543.1 SDR family oxidoreductase [Bacillus sp. DNRA2]
MKKYVLITGASGGIGQAIALKLAKEGYSLYLHYHTNEKAIAKLLTQLEEYGGEYIPIQANLAEMDGINHVAASIFAIDAIVHNSGTSHYGLLVDLVEADLNQLINLHIKTPLLLTKELLPKMLQKRSGAIVVISSIWGQTGAACEVAYSSVKGAQIAFVKALSKEVALNGIRVNGIAPGAIATEMLSDFSEEELDLLRGDIPLGILGAPQHVADGVSFLLSEQSAYITGQILGINGGWYM